MKNCYGKRQEDLELKVCRSCRCLKIALIKEESFSSSPLIFKYKRRLLLLIATEVSVEILIDFKHNLLGTK